MMTLTTTRLAELDTAAGLALLSASRQALLAQGVAVDGARAAVQGAAAAVSERAALLAKANPGMGTAQMESRDRSYSLMMAALRDARTRCAEVEEAYGQVRAASALLEAEFGALADLHADKRKGSFDAKLEALIAREAEAAITRAQELKAAADAPGFAPPADSIHLRPWTPWPREWPDYLPGALTDAQIRLGRRIAKQIEGALKAAGHIAPEIGYVV